jgi:hypothetical protein
MDLPLELEDRTLDDLAGALRKFSPPETWTYLMVNPINLRQILAAINAGQDSGNTLRVWTAAMCFVDWGTNKIMASRRDIAETAGTTPQEVSRAMTRLQEIGAIERIGAGRYKVNANVVFRGALRDRESAARDAPQLRPVT